MNILKNKILMIILLLGVLLKIAMLILNKCLNIYFLFGNINQRKIDLGLNLYVLSALILFIFSKVKIKQKIVLSIVGLFGIYLLIDNFLFSWEHEEYFSFNSPEKTETLVVEENSFLLGGWCRFYKKTGGIFIKKLKPKIETDDGYLPFREKHYFIEWIGETTANVKYDFGDSLNTYKNINVELNE